MTRFLAIPLLLVLAACQTAAPLPDGSPDLAAELIDKRDDTPPKTAEGVCWGSDTVPAVIETVTEQILVEPEARAADGSVVRPAVFRSEQRQRILSDRRDVWFRAPCPEDQTADFIATLQRALKARGIYLEPVTGVADAATASAVRRYQAPLGLDSPVLALATARALGIAAADLTR